jgi:general secretion pathway protein D
MQVDQTTTDVGTASSSANNQPSFLQRQISSKVAVRSGESIVLGGLIKDNTTTSKAGVPFLQDVPVVGKLFGTNASKSNRTELLVIITPRVVRTDVDIREVSEDLRERMRGLQQIQGASTSRSEVAPVAPAGATRAADAQ